MKTYYYIYRRVGNRIEYINAIECDYVVWDSTPELFTEHAKTLDDLAHEYGGKVAHVKIDFTQVP